jgi:hypothetical protein
MVSENRQSTPPLARAPEGSPVRAKPWAHGPLELIRHADGHLQAAGDTDRRIALIGFDNAIEVCIDVFIKLHPKLRKGVEIKNEDAEKALRNYHSKIEFLDEFVARQNTALDVPVEVIVWYHSLRNELYHSGNGMVPELHVVEGARAAAYAVFKALFGFDVAPLTAGVGIKPHPVQSVPYLGQRDEMEFLRIFIDFERSLQIAIQRQHPGGPQHFAALSDLRIALDLFRCPVRIFPDLPCSRPLPVSVAAARCKYQPDRKHNK